MPLSFVRNLFGRRQDPTVSPDSVQPPTAETHPKDEYPVFRLWGKQHERLNITKDGLPIISDDQASSLIRYLVRYEAALGIREALQEGISAHVAKADRELVINLTALEEKTSYNNVAHNFRDELPDDNGEENLEPPAWDQEIALRFIQWVSRLDPFVIATFIYIHSCDQLASGLMQFEPDEQKTFVNEMYHWVLDFEPYPEKH